MAYSNRSGEIPVVRRSLAPLCIPKHSLGTKRKNDLARSLLDRMVRQLQIPFSHDRENGFLFKFHYDKLGWIHGINQYLHMIFFGEENIMKIF